LLTNNEDGILRLFNSEQSDLVSCFVEAETVHDFDWYPWMNSAGKTCLDIRECFI